MSSHSFGVETLTERRNGGLRASTSARGTNAKRARIKFESSLESEMTFQKRHAQGVRDLDSDEVSDVFAGGKQGREATLS